MAAELKPTRAMVYFGYFFSALLLGLLAVVAISLLSGRPMKGLWIFFIIIFFAIWASELWIDPFGPVIWGVSVFPPLVVAVIFTLLILALIPAASAEKGKTGSEQQQEPQDRVSADAPLAVFGFFFWLMVILLVISVITGYYRISNAAFPSAL